MSPYCECDLEPTQEEMDRRCCACCGCQYAVDVGMPEYECVGECQYEGREWDRAVRTAQNEHPDRLA
jgi:hypothetical protein